MFKCQSKAGIISTCVIFCVRKVMNQHSLQFYKELKVVFIRSRTKGDVVRTQYSCERRSTIRLYDTSVREVLQTLLDGLNHILDLYFAGCFPTNTIDVEFTFTITDNDLLLVSDSDIITCNFTVPFLYFK